MPSGPDGLYLALLKKNYVAGSQSKTWPYEKVDDDEEVDSLEDEDDAESDPEEELDQTNVNIIMRKGGVKNVKIPKAKLLKLELLEEMRRDLSMTMILIRIGK